MRGLYAIVDVATLNRAGLDAIPFADAVLSARPAALQVRDKSARRGGAGMLALLKALGPMCRARGVPLLANDRVDLALLAGCDGVHVGQTDVPGSLARTVLDSNGGHGIVGVSAHNDDELERALAERPDYVGLGPVFPTTSKDLPDPTIGLDGLRRLVARARAMGLDTVAIGGVDATRVAAVSAICPSIAMIGALIVDGGYEAIAANAQSLHEAILAGARINNATAT